LKTAVEIDVNSGIGTAVMPKISHSRGYSCSMLNNTQPFSEIFDPAQGQPGLIQEIPELRATKILECTQCGKCAAACPLVLSGFSFYNKRVIQTIVVGFKDLILNDSSIWACQSCNRCTEVCPMGVDPFEIMLATRRMAVREYALPTTAIEGIKSLYDTGHAVYISEAGIPRKKLGLPETPPTTTTYHEALLEVQTIMKKTVLAELGLIPMGVFGITERL